MCTAGTIDKAKQTAKRSERGSGLVFLIGLVAVLLGAMVFMNSQNSVTASQLATARTKVRGDALVTRIHSNLKALFSNYPVSGATCLPPGLSQVNVQAFRKFSDPTTPAPPIVIELQVTAPATSLPSYSCLYDEDDRKLMRSLKIRVTEMSHDSSALVRNLNFTVEVVFAKVKGVVSQNFRLSRDYRFRVLSLSQFGLIFHDNPSTAPFIDIQGRANVAVHATALFADRDIPNWNQLQPTDPKKVVYKRNVYARFPELRSIGAVSVPNFRSSYPTGIQTGVLAQDFIANFLPDTSRTAWNFRFDYYPLYKDVGSPVPEASSPSAVNCLSGSTPTSEQRFDSSRANVTIIPNSSNGPVRLKDTCTPSLDVFSRRHTFLFFRAGEDLTINLDASDANFCGIVVARRLILNVPPDPSPQKYALIGHFAVSSIVVNSSDTGGPAEVRIYNPEENEPFDGMQPLPAGQSFGELASDFKSLASSSAWSFYVPISRSGAFGIKAPNDYLISCPAPMAGYRAYKSQYDPIQTMSAFTGYQSDSVGAVYSMESM